MINWLKRALQRDTERVMLNRSLEDLHWKLENRFPEWYTETQVLNDLMWRKGTTVPVGTIQYSK